MADPLILQVTNAGRAALVAAQTAGTNAVTIAEVGLSASAAVVPSAAATTLPGEHRRVDSVRGAAIGPDTIHMIVEDASAAAYDVRAFALYLADGTLFALYGQAGLILSKAAPAIFLLAIDVQFADIDAANITFGDANFLNPPATETVQGVMEIATNAEALTGTDAQRSITPKTMKYVFDQRLGAFVLKAGDVMTGQLRVDLAGYGLVANDPAGANARLAAALEGAPVAMLQAVPTGARLAALGAKALALATNGVDRVSIAADGAVSTAGNLTVGAALYAGGDTAFSLSVQAGNPVLGVAAGDFLQFDRAADAFGFVVAGQPRFGVDGDGATAFGRFAATGNVTAGGALYAGGDGAFSLSIQAGNPVLALDGGDFLQFTRASNSFVFATANAVRLAVDGDGAALTGRLTATTNITAGGAVYAGDGNLSLSVQFGDPVLTFDAGGDALRFSRSANEHQFDVGGTTRATIGAAGLAVAGAITRNGHQLWDVGNDGAGSGLDADLLDGLQGAAYALRSQNVTFRDITADRGDGTGVVFLNGAATRFLFFDGTKYSLPAAPLHVNGGAVWTAANDGAGSGLDADLLDGLHASQFWRPDNDGPGSGLDADTLDGLQASAFPRIVASDYSASGGYEIWSTGFKRCWGSGSVGGSTSGGATYPFTFDGWSRAFLEGGAAIANAQDNNPFVSGTSTTGFTVYNAHNGTLGFSWHAFGV